MKRIFTNEFGTSFTEVACIAALTVVVAIASLGYLGSSNEDAFLEACHAMEDIEVRKSRRSSGGVRGPRNRKVCRNRLRDKGSIR